jgi:hypothetical protein
VRLADGAARGRPVLWVEIGAEWRDIRTGRRHRDAGEKRSDAKLAHAN